MTAKLSLEKNGNAMVEKRGIVDGNFNRKFPKLKKNKTKLIFFR